MRIRKSFILIGGAMLMVGCGDLTSLLSLLGGTESRAWVLRWNQIAIDTSGLDHTAFGANALDSVYTTRTFGHQLGPTRSSRAMAMAHIALFEAVNAIEGGFQSYLGTAPVGPLTSERAAIAQAVHDTLVGLYPSHAPRLDDLLAEDLNDIPDSGEKSDGILLGQQVAAAILALRTGDGSTMAESYTFSDQPGYWRVDPLNPGQGTLGSQWSHVTPFVLTRSNQFRTPPPPEMDSDEYTAAYNEVKGIGGDGVTTPTSRTAEQTQIGLFWAYDGTPSLCAPPRLYNQIASKIGTERGLNGTQMARMLALVNVAMADTGISVWESKYYYNFWRPVTGIRESDVGTGPSGLGDGNPDTTGDPTYVPLCAPASNLTAPNFTPPFPAYPSGHAGFGGALFGVLRSYYGTDNISFSFTSDEFNGVTKDNNGVVRPMVTRSYTSLSQAEEENGQSRIYLGIHWTFDKSEGIAQGNRVADYVMDHVFQPSP
ncbi:MAG: phosphatase PAP2 family protein [Phycisphaerae bacterium]